MLFYPNASYILPMTTVRRERRLPPDVTNGEVLVREGQRVDSNTPILRGARSSMYRIVSLLAPLGVRRAEDIDPGWIRVAERDSAEVGQVLAQRGTGRRARKVLAPVDCIVMRIEPGRLILQANPEEIELKAIVPGTVTSIRGRTAIQIEGVGALIQCAWGNGHSSFGIYKEEPEGGLQTLADEQLLTTFRNQILLTRKPISAQTFVIAKQQEVSAIIAPSMASSLRPVAQRTPIPVILTEGFGAQQMSEIVYNLLKNNLGRQTAIDASEPARWSSDRPEIFIPLASGGSLPPAPAKDQPLLVGSMVRMARAPLAGLAGRVKRIVETPQNVENGLRLAGVEVQLTDGRTVFVPVANIEMLGRASDNKS